MHTSRIACCYHPTRVVFVDDNHKFHTSMKLLLDRKKATYQFYSDPSAALHFLKSDYNPNPFVNHCLLRPEEQHRDHRNIDVDVRVIHQEFNNSERFDEISVIVVDYAMPVLDGLEFCKQLRGKPFKIILLTGEADEKIATRLFNDGLIHKFIRKTERNFEETLSKAIQELQEEYFKDLSTIVIDSLTKIPEHHPVCCLDDPVFINFFEQFCQQHKFVEYYLLEATGSFLFLDIDGKPSMLLVKDDDEMEGALCDAELSDAEVPADVMKSIKDRSMLLHRYTDEECSRPPSEWRSLLHSAKKLEGRATYYYAYVDDPKKCLDVSGVLSYKAYLSKL
jgi:CheY-like chemotaxis protein